MNAAPRTWLPALAPALVFVLLAVQVALGLRGFDRPHAGPLGALELPGRMLGWGGVALLVPLFSWLLLGWLGVHVTSLALKTLGAITLGLAVGGLASVWGGEAQGGWIGGPLGGLLVDALGRIVATALLIVMVVPGALLSAARFQAGSATPQSPAERVPAPPARSKGSTPPSAPSLKPNGAGKAAAARAPSAPAAAPTSARPSGAGSPGASPTRAQGWYPQRRYDAEGNELPMSFGNAGDVGAIRYRDEPPATVGSAQTGPGTPAPSTSSAAPPASATPSSAVTSADAKAADGWPKGLVSEPEEPVAPSAPAPAGAAPAQAPATSPIVPEVVETGRMHVDGRTPHVRPSVPGRSPETAPGPKVFARQLFPKNPGDSVLLPGVRYREEAEVPPAPAPKTPPPPAPVPAPAPTSATRPSPPATASPTAPHERGAAPGPESALGAPVVPFVRHAASPSEVPPTEHEHVSRALEPLGDVAAMARYRSKLEASGIFGSPPPAPPAAPPTPPTPPVPPAPPVQSTPQEESASTTPPARRKKAAPHHATGPAPASAPEEPTGEKATREKAAREKAPAGRSAKGQKARSGSSAGHDTHTGSLFEHDATRPSPATEGHDVPAPAPTAAPKSVARPPPPRGAWVAELKDAEFLKAVEAAIERGSASPVLLTRRMGLAYTRAQALVERMAKTGVLGEVAPNGTRPVLIRAEDLAAARP